MEKQGGLEKEEEVEEHLVHRSHSTGLGLAGQTAQQTTHYNLQNFQLLQLSTTQNTLRLQTHKHCLISTQSTSSLGIWEAVHNVM